MRALGVPVAVLVGSDSVSIWVSSPTGDSSDTFTFNIPCLSPDQAETIGAMWRTAWGVN